MNHTLVRIRAQGAAASLGIELHEPLSEAASYAEAVDRYLLVGTLLGIKGVDPSPGAVETLAEAGADCVILGSLIFGHPDPCTAVRWLQSLGSWNHSIEPRQSGGTQP